ncbi:hypothetical protein GCM10009112_21630 [Marinomonas arenicola]|uniref:polyribonucleotide nucleotidyltransferase n=1 Tax=Marinomonas TaxID=28253 RepID=UPI001054CB5B|nr:polyribonucleotide nucleotidyltransferase [Marinomonas sp. KMM3893]
MQSKIWVRGVVASVLVTQLSACGTLLYPERRGQTTGTIDVGVALLDAVGLLFFFVPGVVAFGVDFVTGGIYLPGGRVATLTPEERQRVTRGKDAIDVAAFKQVLAERDDLALPAIVSSDRLKAVSMSSQEAMMNALHDMAPNQQLALAKVYR